MEFPAQSLYVQLRFRIMLVDVADYAADHGGFCAAGAAEPADLRKQVIKQAAALKRRFHAPAFPTDRALTEELRDCLRSVKNARKMHTFKGKIRTSPSEAV